MRVGLQSLAVQLEQQRAAADAARRDAETARQAASRLAEQLAQGLWRAAARSRGDEETGSGGNGGTGSFNG